MKLRVNKNAASIKAATDAADMVAINHYTLRELTPEDVFVFRCIACDDQVDRDFERFPVESLQKLAALFVGKTVIHDHNWSSKKQQARIYAASVEVRDGANCLVSECYMLRNDATKDVIAAIEGGILREVSVGCSVSRAVCSVCGEDYGTCGHRKGIEYDGAICHVDLLDPIDAYELSFVAVPAQPGAGVTKETHESCWTPADLDRAKCQLEIERERWI